MYHYPFHVRDYVARTRHLSPMEDLAYRRLLDTYYTDEKPLPPDTHRCARLIAMPEAFDAVDLVLNEFFDLREDGWHNERCDEELAKYRAMSDGGRKGASIRWAKGGDSHPNGSPNKGATKGGNNPPIDPLIATKNQEPRTKKPPVVPQGDDELGFAEFWTAYPRKDGRAPALKSWLKIKPDESLRQRIIAAVKARAVTKEWTKDNGQFIPMATTYLNNSRWEDELATAEAGFWAEQEPWQ